MTHVILRGITSSACPMWDFNTTFIGFTCILVDLAKWLCNVK